MRHAATFCAILCLAPAALCASPESVAAADIARLPVEARPFVRYFDTSAVGKVDKAALVAALRFQVNSLSSEAEPIAPAQVSETLLRVDIRDYGWDAKVWEKLAEIDPYFHVRIQAETVEEWGTPDGRGGYTNRFQKKVKTGEAKGVLAPWLDVKAITYLATETRSQAPIVRGDWFLVQTARQLSLNNKADTGAGYYDFLGLKKRDDLFRLVALNEKESKRVQREVRAALDRSGVSQQGRQIVRFQAITGGVWITLDVKDDTGKGNPVRNLRDGDYIHDAEEIYGVLPNGLPVTWAGDAKGNRQDSAPDFIGPDDSPLRRGRDARIHVHLACARCHAGNVLQPVDDWARRTYAAGSGVLLASPDYSILKTLRRQYLSDLNGALEADRLAYQKAIKAACGLEAEAAAKALAKAFHDYADRPLALGDVARELGCDEAAMKAAIVAYAKGKGIVEPEIVGLLGKGTIIRTHFEELYSVLKTLER